MCQIVDLTDSNIQTPKNENFHLRRVGFSIIISFSLILFLFFRVGLGDFIKSVSRMDGFLFVIACLIAIPNEVARSLRWSQILKAQKINLSPSKALQYFLMGLYASVITPGKIGDLLRSHLIARKEKKSIGYTTASVIFDRLLDLGLMIGITTLGVLLFFTPKDWETETMRSAVLLLAIFAILSVFLTYIIFSTGFGKLFLSKLSRIVIGMLPKIFSKNFHPENEVNDFYKAIDLYRSNYGHLIIAAVFSLAAWVFLGIQGYILFLAFGGNLEVSFWIILFFIAFTSFAALIPFTISGIGLREALFIALFAIIRINKADALAYSLVFTTIAVWIPAIVGGLLLTKTGYIQKEIST